MAHLAAIGCNGQEILRVHLAAIGCNGQEILRAHLAVIGCNGLTSQQLSLPLKAQVEVNVKFSDRKSTFGIYILMLITWLFHVCSS